jgi:hypothetical protein
MNFSSKFLNMTVVAFVALISGCGGGDGGSSQQENNTTIEKEIKFEGEKFAQLKAYIETEQSDELLSCFAKGNAGEYCDLSEASPLGAGKTMDQKLSIEDVAERLLVSHEWMGDEFVELLERWYWLEDRDILDLFRPYSSIVISFEGQFYGYYFVEESATLVLSGFALWKDKQQYEDLFVESGGSSSHSGIAEIPFQSWQRQIDSVTKQETYQSIYYDEYDNNVRFTHQLRPQMMQIIAHTSAHAFDSYPQSTLSSLDEQDSLFTHVQSLALSNLLENNYPVYKSDLVTDFANYRYDGATPTDRLVNSTGQEFYDELVNSQAITTWGYHSAYESLAMLFQQYALYKYEGVIMDLSVVGWEDNDYYCNEYEVIAGRRGYSDDVKARMAYAASIVLGIDMSVALDDLAEVEEKSIPAGLGYCESEDFELDSQARVARTQSELNEAMYQSTVHKH